MPAVTEANKIKAIYLKRSGDTIQRRRGSGRRRATALEEDEMLVNLVENRSFTTAAEAVRVTHFPASVRIAQRRLKQSGLRNQIAAKKMLLTPRHREARVGFALEYLARDQAFWNRVVFSDEKVFQSSRNDSIRVYPDAWYTLLINYNKNLCLSMSRHLAKVEEANGAMTKNQKSKVARRKRVSNFTEAEIEVLVSDVEQKRATLFGSLKGPKLTHFNRDVAWNTVLDCVNAVAPKANTFKPRGTKDRWGENEAPSPFDVHLKVVSFIGEESIECIIHGGIDTYREQEPLSTPNNPSLPPKVPLPKPIPKKKKRAAEPLRQSKWWKEAAFLMREIMSCVSKTIYGSKMSFLRNMLHEQQKFTVNLSSEIRDFKVQSVECFKKRTLETDDEIDGKRRKRI
ncbi:hypothetical protein Zmor_006071 [Zophobas morio]|uniref:Regulatory protein zeste n=1 Tax=Zophobas morio TaxID=2755281 RepID=A0AA38IVJ6_9CUCU|nr:hypothetical protein Zmor_006071 [Zophobas morio]